MGCGGAVALLADLYARSAWADLGAAHLMLGEAGAAEESFSRGLAASSLTQYVERTRLLGGLALSLVVQGDLGRADTLLTEARDFATARSFLAADPLLDYVEGEIHRVGGRRTEATAALERAFAASATRGQRLLEAAAAQSLSMTADDPIRYEDLARRTIEEIGHSIIDEDLRSSFLRRWSEPVALACG